jgi:hypothetical protein
MTATMAKKSKESKYNVFPVVSRPGYFITELVPELFHHGLRDFKDGSLQGTGITTHEIKVKFG